MGFHLGEVKVWPKSSLNELVCVEVEVDTEVKQAARDRLAVNCEVLLLQVPASGASNEGGEGAVGTELVLLLALLEVDLSANGIIEIELAVDHVVPGRCARVCVE